jgi:hypothetical protein
VKEAVLVGVLPAQEVLDIAHIPFYAVQVFEI